jgi:hypothetical protein
MSANVDSISPKYGSVVTVYPINFTESVDSYTATTQVQYAPGLFVPITFSFKRYGDILAIGYSSFTVTTNNSVVISLTITIDPKYNLKPYVAINPIWSVVGYQTPNTFRWLNVYPYITATSFALQWDNVPNATEFVIPSTVIYYSYHANTVI